MPDSGTLSSLVTTVTEKMFDLSFTLHGEPHVGIPWTSSDGACAVGISLAATPPVLVIVASDRRGGRGMASAMFSSPEEEVDDAMVADALGELVNIVGGQLKGVLGEDHALGLPTIVTSRLAELGAHAPWSSAHLRNTTRDISLWIATVEMTKDAKL